MLRVSILKSLLFVCLFTLQEIDFVRFMMLLVNPDAAPAIPEPPVVDFWSELDGGENVVQLSDATFDDVIQNEESALVMFFAPCE